MIKYPLPEDIDKEKLPRHIAIIMDGNGRWAKKRFLPRIAGHKAGVDAVREIVQACGEVGIDYLTLYTFSSENWSRPKREVSSLMKLLWKTLQKEVDNLDENNVRLRTIGRMHELPEKIQQEFNNAIDQLSENTGLTLILALNYGSRTEIEDMVKTISQKVEQGELTTEDITEQTISSHLYTSDFPDPDLLIRTGGEIRLSNYLLWQSAYTEFYFTDTYWPNFDPDKLYDAIKEFQQRERRFGGLVEES